MAQRDRQENDRTIYRFRATKAIRSAFKLRAGICGAGGSGKSYSALAIASRLAERFAVPLFAIDSENESLLKYAKSKRTGRGFDFMHVALPANDFSPDAYSAALDYCIGDGAGVIVIDSLSHEWEGSRGVLEQVDEITDRAQKPNGKAASAFSSGWKEMKPVHNRLIQQILRCPAHVIFTIRAKTKYKVVGGKPEKEGEGPAQCPGIEYEPDLFWWMADSVLMVDKTRCDSLEPLSKWPKPGAEFADILADWIEDAEPPADPLLAAIDLAVADGVLAAEERTPAKYKIAKDGLLTWCKANGLPSTKAEWAAQQFKERVAAVVGPKQAATPDASALEPLP